MEVFWEKGYEGATLEELLEAMGGITPPSLYHAFGSKEELFREAVQLYVKIVGEPTIAAMEEAESARDGVEALLRETALGISRPGKPHGCLLVSSAAKCSRGSEGAQDYVRAWRLRAPDAIKARLKRAVAEGELDASVDIGAAATFYATFLHGLGVRAADGASRANLASAIDGAMAAWPGLTSTRSSSRRKRG